MTTTPPQTDDVDILDFQPLTNVHGTPALPDPEPIEDEHTIALREAATGSREPWTVNSVGAAAWALERIAEFEAAKAQIARIAADRSVPAQARLEQINAWMTDAHGPLDESIGFFNGHLTRWHAEELERDPKRISIKLPAGTLASRAGQAKWAVEDATFVPWATTRPDAAKLIEEKHARRDITELKAALVLHPIIAIHTTVDEATGELAATPLEVDKNGTFVVPDGDDEVTLVIANDHVASPSGRTFPIGSDGVIDTQGGPQLRLVRNAVTTDLLELVPGVTVTPATRSFSVKLAPAAPSEVLF